MDRGCVVVPWEHWVCTQCLEDNPYAVWLIKLKCLKPTHHDHCYPSHRTLVAIEPSIMKLVKMRHPPPTQSSGSLELCRSYPHCRHMNSCPSPHSEVEKQTWAFIRALFNDKHLKELLRKAKLVPQSPTKACVKCYDEAAPDYNTRWLTWLECAQPYEHANEERMTLIVGDDHEVIEVLELPSSLSDCHPSHLTLCTKMHKRGGCPDGYYCNSPHRNEELEYWKWTIVHKRLKEVLNYDTLCERYSYTPDETMLSKEGLKQKMSPKNYVNKFHKLVYLDELAHCQSMASLCNGRMMVQKCVYYDEDMLKLSGMEGAAMDYARHGHAIAYIPLGDTDIQCSVSPSEEDSLLLYLPYRHPPIVLQQPTTVYVHFEINHNYFDGLHKAIDYLSPDAINKLFPSRTDLTHCKTGRNLTTEEKSAIAPFTLDNEYQMNALKRMISSDPGIPFLVLGPFGTGKTHILAATVSALLCNRSNHILVCTHQHQCADHIYQTIFRRYPNAVLRVIPKSYEKALKHDQVGKEGIVSLKYAKSKMFEKQVVVTTFLTATNLRQIKDARDCPLIFSHILIDEGAQTREPETLGALAVAKPETKIVIVGDNKQNGPRVVVLSDLAQKNELGYSLLERLFANYKTANPKSTCIQNHTASLLTNYRCHSSILTLTSSLFYEHTLLSRSSSQTHPLAPYPLVFTCSSIEKRSLKSLPAENVEEAKLLVERLNTFVKKWPRKYPKKDVVGLLASTRKQVNILKHEAYKKGLKSRNLPCEVKVLPTHLIQGEQFEAVFLSTIEPTDEYEDPYDSVRSISNEYVFNTIMTRARSLIYCVGNPFVLCKLGDQYSINCWSAYLQRCVQCETLQFAFPKEEVNEAELKAAAEEIQQIVFPHKVIDQATAVSLTSEAADNIINQYIQVLKGKKEYQIGCRLVRTPQGEVNWKGDEEATGDNVILCRLEYSFFNKAKAVPLDPSQPATVIKGANKLKGSLPGDTVRVDPKNGCVLFDEEQEKAIKSTHFGSSFLCRVSEYNCIQFYPLDKCYPKFVNLPTITREEKMGVVCFDPSSINSTPKVCNVIPHEIALKMVFIVKFLGWKKECGYPLGIIIGALPSKSSHLQELFLKMKHSIPLSIAEYPIETTKCQVQTGKASQRKHFPHAITIDPEGSTDHDDALTCTFKQKGKNKTYYVGVHITSLNDIVRKGSPVDKQAQERGCTVYNAPDSIGCPMFPASVLNLARIDTGKQVDAFTILTEFKVADEELETESIELGNVSITESTVTSQAELTYAEAQYLLTRSDATYPKSLIEKRRSYTSQSPALPLKLMTRCLWKFAWFLRQKRLKDAALAYTVRENDTLLHLEAHYLIEEFMIWANQQVATKLCKYYKNQTILKSQQPPDKEKLEQFAKNFKTVLPLSAACKHLLQGTSEQGTTVSALIMLKSEHSRLQEDLKKKQFRDIMHCVQVEHLQPQLAVLQSVLRGLQSPAQYCVLKQNDKDDGGHYDLQCPHYTHFTSPLRRYVDIVVHRQLHAALYRERNAYTAEELNTVCITTQNKQKHAKTYERDVQSLELVNTLKESQRECDCIISQVNRKQGTISLCITDSQLRLGQKNSEITTQQLHKNHSKAGACSEPAMPYTWKVKLCSLSGTPASFLDPAEVVVSSTSDKHGQLTFYTPDESECLIKKSVNITVKSKVNRVPSQTWLMLQDCTMKGEASINANRDAILRNINAADDTCTPVPHKTWRSILCVYTLNKVLKPFDVMKVQLCATQAKHMMEEPAIQLLEVGPGLRICVHHNKDPTKCFVGRLTKSASKDVYKSLEDYVNSWKPLILAEAAYASVKESEFLLIRDVPLKWPKFQFCTSSAGHSYYKMTESADPDKCGVMVTFPPEFVKYSLPFLRISKGDLVCIRFSSSDGATKYVFHMVINKVDIDEDKPSPAQVYMKFVLDDSNYISQQVYREIQKNEPSYKIQLIPSSLPLRRIYRSLTEITSGTELAQRIARGISTTAHSGNSPRMEDVLSPSELSIANSYWPIKDKRKLNEYQRKAIKLAWDCKFSMIQGPPGTGKSVTGAHIAYALAMRLCKERSGNDSDKKKCVMYCGPSQQSVNVVLDIFLQLLQSPGLKQDDIRIIRVFSKTVEKADFPGLELNSDLFPHFPSSTQCETRHEPYSLHHKVRRENPDIAIMEERFKTLHHQGIFPSFKDIKEYRNMVSSAQERVLKRGVNIVLCTCNEAASHRITNLLDPKYCIIDECAMATEPECMVPIRRAEHVVLIGDHQQLQPVIQCKEVENMGLGKSLFERYAQKGAKMKIHLLEVQYRMHVAVCDFPSEAFYYRRLKTHQSVEKRHTGVNLNRFWPKGEQMPMVFCQVEGKEDNGHIGSKRGANVESKSKFNKDEAKKIVDIAEKLVCQWNVPNSEMAILTPYSAQKEAISEEVKQRRQLQKRIKERGDIHIKSITESQGSEYGIVLLSTVRSQHMSTYSSETADEDWIRKNLGFVSDPHRICVGITRCKFGLVIVGNEKVLKYDRIWKKLIDHYKRKGCFVKGDSFPH